MGELIVFCIIVVSIVAAIFLSWLYYQKAMHTERMYLLENGANLAEILKIQKENRFRITVPWLNLGILIVGLGLAFLAIALLIKIIENDLELFKGFLISFILCICLGGAMITNYFIARNQKSPHGK